MLKKLKTFTTKSLIICNSIIILSSIILSGCEHTDIGDFNYDFIEGTTRIISYNGTERNIVIPDSIENRDVTIISNYAFGSEYSGLEMKNESNIDYKPASDLINISFPDTLINIGEGAFQFCTSLEKVDLSNCYSFTFFDKYAFSGCSSLKTIIFSDSTQYICENAFSNCKSLTKVTIPQSVNAIFSNAFNGCTNLTDVYFESDSVNEYFADNTFDNCSEYLVLHAPKNSTIETYANNNNICFKEL